MNLIWGPTSRRDFCRSLGGLTVGTMAVGAARSAAAGGTPAGQTVEPILSNHPRIEIHVGSRRQLLFDDFFVATGFWTGAGNHPQDIPYNISWSLGSAEKAGQILLHADQPWESTSAWYNVLYDGGRYRLWYGATKTPEPGWFVSYAESDDGVSWHKPVVNLIEKHGSTSNNIVFQGADAWDVAGASVFIDPTAKPAERYKMVFSAWESHHAYPNEHYPFAAEAGVLRGASFSDGLHWTQYSEIFLGRYPDAHSTATYDPVLGKYVAYVRASGNYGGLEITSPPLQPTVRGRSVGRLESWNYHQWEPVQLVLEPNFEDGLDVDFYDPAYSRYEEVDHAHFLIPGAYHHRTGRIDPQIAVSRDGKSWMRPTRQTFIPQGAEDSFDSLMVRPGPGILPVGKDHRAIYYRGNNVPHPGGLAKPTVKPIDAMSRAVFKRDRIVGIEAVKGEAGFATRPLIFAGRHLLLNVEPTGPDPRLAVELIGVGLVPGESKTRGKFMDDGTCPGYSMEDCIPLSGDEIDGVVRWKDRAEVGEWAGKPIRLRFRLQSMRIYAFQFVA